jgi:hypothetical protein
MVQIQRERDLPLHFEASPLNTAVKIVGWALGVLAVAGGITLFVRAELVAAEVTAMAFTVIGGTVVVLLVRCRRYEVTVGERLVELRLGPFRRTFPSGCINEATPGIATGWRRFYATHELVISPSVETRRLIVPTSDPDELREALVRNP